MSQGFSTLEIDVRTSDGRNFTLLSPFSYTARDGTVYTVPAGTTSDGASTPRLLWREIPPFGQYWLAAFLHDWLYRCSTFPKVLCDALLLEAMTVLQVSPLEAHAIFEGVHLGGWSSFDADRAAQTTTP